LDYGIESPQSVKSSFYGAEKNEFAESAGRIVLSTEKIARNYANPSLRVAVIRAQNWATLQVVRRFFSLPLFNNYTSVLAGQIILTPRLSFKDEVILYGGVMADYGIAVNSFQDWSTSPIRKSLMKTSFILNQQLRRLPNFLQIWLRNIVKWATRI
jgi:hypothetical protein